MKKILSLLLSVVLIIAMVPMSAINAKAEIYSGSCPDNLTWEFDDSTGILTISGSGNMKNYSSTLYVPWYEYATQIKQILFDGSITNIGNYVFCNCSNLTEITIPDSVTSIGYYSFSGCTGLTSITIGSGVTSIGNYAFDGCTNLKTVNNYSACPIKKGNSSYGYVAYYADTVYWDADINGTCGENLTWEFDEHSDTLTIAGSGDMSNYSQNDIPWRGYSIKSVSLSDDLTSIGDYAFYNRSALTKITIPDSVTSIGNSAFYNCINLTEINIPDNVVSIDNNAFYNCIGLTEITIPYTVANIGGSAFYGCENLKNINNYSKLKISKGASENGFIGFYADVVNWYYPLSGSCGKNLTYTFQETTGTLIVIGNGAMTDYSSFSFAPWYNYRSLIKNIELPQGLTYISDFAFYDCDSLTEIIIPNSVTKIGSNAFSYSNGLTKIIIPNSVTIIKEQAFSGCNGLTEITLKSNAISIGDYAFYNCTNLKTVNNYSDLSITKGSEDNGYIAYYADYVNDYAFGDLDNSFKWELSLTTGLLTINGTGEMLNYNLFSSTPWCEYANQIKAVEIDKNITKVGTYSFYGCENLTEIACENMDLQFGAYALNSTNDFTVFSISGGNLENYCNTNGFEFETLVSTPELDNVTSNSIIVKSAVGIEYSLDGITWQTGNKFTDLSAVTDYTVYARRRGVLTEFAAKPSEALNVTTIKKTASSPINPVIADAEGSTVMLQVVIGYEYSMDNEVWQSSNIFTNLDKNVIYSFYQRIAETTDTFASLSSVPAKAVLAGNPKIDYIGYDCLEIKAINGYEYSLDKINWQQNNKFESLVNGLEYTVYQRLTDSNIYCAVAEGTTITVNGKNQANTPSAPTETSKTDTTVTLTAKSGYEYKLGNGAWQSSNVFSGLSPNKTYSFYQRIAATNTAYASGSSNALTVTTNKSTVAKPSAPTLSGKTETSITLTAKSGYEYSKNGTTWQKSNVFTGLNSGTQYTFYQRIAETDTAYASEKSNALTVTTVSSVPSTTTSTTHTVNGSIISKITAGTTVNNLLSGLSAGQYCKVYKGDSEVAGTSKVGTGMVVKIMDGNTVKTSYTVIVTGDTNGDGDITITDMLAIKAHVLKKSTLSGDYATAADTSGDGGVTITDFIQVKAKILGKGNIVAR